MIPRVKRLCLAFALGVVTLEAPGLASAASDPIQFDTPVVIDQPPVLQGDAGDGRCPDPSQPCLKGVDDLLFGQTQLLRSDDLVLTSNTALLLTTTQDSTATSAGTRNLNGGAALVPAPRVVGARMFNTPSDTAVTLMPTPGGSVGFMRWQLDGLSGTLATGETTLAQYNSDAVFAVAADVNGDGFDEVVIWVSYYDGPEFGGGMIATAVDPQDPSKGLQFGPIQMSNSAPMGIAKVLVAGQPRVIVAGHPPSSAGCGFGRIGLSLDSYTIDPQSLALNPVGSFTPSLSEGNTLCVSIIGIAAGRYSTAARDQLAVLYAGHDNTIKVIPFDLDPQGNPVQQPAFDTTYPSGGATGGNARINSGRFDWSSPLDQAAVLVSNCFNCPGINTLRILSFGPAFQVQPGPVYQAAAVQNVCDGDLVVGNFDRQQTNPQPPPATVGDPNLQLAVPFNDCVGTVDLRIFDVDPATNFTISLHSELSLVGGGNGMAALDLQGRSLRVGRPDIVIIDKRQQATLVLAAPPMHVDAVEPISGGGLRPFNITGAPDGFYAGYSFSSSTDNKTDTTTDLTWSFSAKETFEQKVTAGDCEVGDCASAGIKASAQQALDGSKSTLTGSYSGSSQNLNVTTGFSDILSYQSESLTIYLYPALGRSVCPSTIPNCTDAQKVQLTINMAGPDTLLYKEAQPGAALPWYQPVWIPGNLLSYPGNVGQLKAAAGDDLTVFEELSEPASWFVGAGGSAGTSINWTGGGSTGSTSSFKQNYSFEADMSVSWKAGFADVFTGEVSADLDLSGSVGFSNLTDSLKTLSATQGIQLTRTASFLEDLNYGYEVTPHIFGKKQPTTVVDNTTTPAGVQTFGALRTGHEVDLSSGGFWQAWYGKAPDLALNQPAHWTITLTGSDAGNGSCLNFNPGTSDYDCLSLGDRLPPALGEPIWLSAFHWMRGLFISGPTGGGPQLTTATSGDQLLVQARVYNLSLAALGADVHVRFMAMPWDSGTNVPAGASFQIGEQVLGGAQLPPYNTDTDYPNWTLAAQPFDTSGTNCGGQSCDNLDLVFWVVLWAQDGNGPLIEELPQHGLGSIPAAGEDFMAVAAREQPYSNNLGVYNQVFHLFPKTPALRSPTPEDGEIGAAIVLVGSAVRELPRGQATALAAKVDTGGRDLNAGLEVAFYDGDPRAGGTLIGAQQQPFLNADSRYDFRVLFRPATCGLHTVHAVAGEGTRHAHSVAFKPIEVRCNDLAKLAGRIVAKTGTQTARTWTIALSNTGAAAARDAQIKGLTLTQTSSGQACTPVIVNPAPFPLPLGSIAAGGTANGAVTINFAGCAPAARFRADITFGSNNGIVSGAATLNNQFR